MLGVAFYRIASHTVLPVHTADLPPTQATGSTNLTHIAQFLADSPALAGGGTNTGGEQE